MILIAELFTKKNSGEIARKRLKHLLTADRAGCSPELLDLIRADFLRSVSRYLEIDPGDVTLRILRTSSEPVSYTHLLVITQLKNGDGGEDKKAICGGCSTGWWQVFLWICFTVDHLAFIHCFSSIWGMSVESATSIIMKTTSLLSLIHILSSGRPSRFLSSPSVRWYSFFIRSSRSGAEMSDGYFPSESSISSTFLRP